MRARVFAQWMCKTFKCWINLTKLRIRRHSGLSPALLVLEV